MIEKVARISLIGLTAFDALTAIGGGCAMLTGLDRFPLVWLQGTPFTSYTIPAVLLTGVGGCALAAAGLVLARWPVGWLVSMAAGILMSGYQTVEVLLLHDGQWISGIEAFYFGLGAAIFLLAVFLRSVERRSAHNRQISPRPV